MEDAIMGFQGGVGWHDEDSPLGPYDTEPLDDPLIELSIMKAAKAIRKRADEIIWENEETRPEEIPEELKEAGAILVSIREVKKQYREAKRKLENSPME